jgi:hypothetical protein
MMEFKPALFGCYIWRGNRSFKAIRESRECVINVPTLELLDQVVAIGNSHAEKKDDKFETTGLTAEAAAWDNSEMPREPKCMFTTEKARPRWVTLIRVHSQAQGKKVIVTVRPYEDESAVGILCCG